MDSRKAWLLEMSMPPPLIPSELPRLHIIGEYAFQDLTCALLEREPGISSCTVYGRRGEKQRGIDLLGRRANGTGLVAGQCKCYPNFTPHQIVEASDEFFKHLGYWKERGVNEFVLIVACDLSQTSRQEELIGQRDRFQAEGLVYDWWDVTSIRNRLGPHRDLAARYLTSAWVDAICGAPAPSMAVASSVVQQVSAVEHRLLVSQLEQLAPLISHEAEEALDRSREIWHQGGAEEVLVWVQEYRAQPIRWSLLDPRIQARFLRFEANLILVLRDDIGAAIRLADEANALSSEDDNRLRALIALYQVGPDAAQTLLVDREDIDSVNLRCAFLLDLGRLDDCQTILDSALATDKANAETKRLRAVVYLLRGEVDQAILEIEQARNIAGSWRVVRFTDAAIHYFSALSVAAIPNRLPPWPEPVNWALVRSDDLNLARLRHAAREFASLASQSNLSTEERQAAEAWQAACLCNDSEHQDEALAFCRSIVEVRPDHYQVLAWVVARGFNIELEPSIQALKLRVQENKATASLVLVLAACYLASAREDDAVHLLLESQGLFADEQALALWTQWYVRALVAKGDPDSALNTLNESSTTERLDQVRAIALEGQARRSGDWTELKEFLRSTFEKDNDSLVLLQYCQLLARQGQWSLVADFAEQLTIRVGTVEALRVALAGTWNTKRFELCFQLMEGYQGLFPGGKLPSDLRSLRVECLRAMGILSDAVTEARALAYEEPTLENLLHLADLQLVKGDMRGLVTTGHAVASHPELTAESALRMAEAVLWEDQTLAVQLWKRACESELTDSLVAPAVIIGHRLGLTIDLAPLSRRLGQLAQAGLGNARAVSFEELRVSFLEDYQNGQRVYELYEKGNILVHLLAERLNISLADLYHRNLLDNEVVGSPLQRPALYVRHGGRRMSLGLGEPPARWRLNLDVTALLLATHLDILDAVETTFKPLRIPYDLVGCLREMREKATPHQPASLRNCQAINDLVEEGALHVIDVPEGGYRNSDGVSETEASWLALLEVAQSRNGYFLDFLPLRRPNPESVPTEFLENTKTCLVDHRAIVDNLRQQGPLSEGQHAQAIQSLGTIGDRSHSEATVEQGRPLYCYGTVLELLASVNILRAVCERFPTYIEQSELDRIRAMLRESENQQRTAKWLDRLIARVSAGLEDGRYQAIPRPLANGDATDEDRHPSGLMHILQTLLGFEVQEEDVIWIDDRFLTGYLYRDIIRIVGTNEVLKNLVAYQVISPADYYGYLLRMRVANVLYLSIDEDEVLHHLKGVRINVGHNGASVVETSALRSLRRSLAAAVLSGRNLQRSGTGVGAFAAEGEIQFILSIVHTASQAIHDVWSIEGIDINARVAWADWLLTYVYLNPVDLATLTGIPATINSPGTILANSLSLLILQAVGLDKGTDLERQVRRAYFDWIDSRLLRPKFDVEPHYVPAVTEALKDHVVGTIREAEDQGHGAPSRLILARLVEDLPDILRDQMLKDTDFAAQLGMSYLEVVNIGNLSFSARDYWLACERAVNGTEARLTPSESEVEVKLSPFVDDQGRPGFAFSHPMTGETVELANEELFLLRESISEREAMLLRNRHLYDGPDVVVEQSIAEIVTLADAEERMRRSRAWRATSMERFYSNLRSRFRQSPHFRFDNLMPSATQHLLGYLRLQPSTDPHDGFAAALRDAAVSLVSHEGVEVALERLSGLPVPLPSPVLDAVSGLSNDERRSLIKRLLRVGGSPVSKAHFLHLIALFAQDDPALARLARRVLRCYLAVSTQQEFQAFRALLVWVDHEFDAHHEFRDMAPHLRLAIVWTHAHQLFSILAASGAPYNWIEATFVEHAQDIPLYLFEPTSSYKFDVAHPSGLSWVFFALAAVGYAISPIVRDVLTAEMRKYCAQLAFPHNDVPDIPIPGLLRNPAPSLDGLCSFLGGEARLRVADLLAPPHAHTLTEMVPEEVVDTVLAILEGSNGTSAIGWAILWAVQRELPLSGAASKRLRALAETTDFAAMFREDQDAAMLAIRVVIGQLRNLDDSQLITRVRSHMTAIAQEMNRRTTLSGPVQGSGGPVEVASAEHMRVAHRLGEWALGVALTEQSLENAMAQFGEMLDQLADAWPAVTAIYGLTAFRLWRKLPADEARHFVRLAVRYRAMS